MTRPDRRYTRLAGYAGWGASTWAAAIGAALLVSLVVAVRNYFSYRMHGAPMPFWIVYVGEIPLWLVWAFLLPGIVALARRFPIYPELI